jgi:DNA mismatch endonuclease (patch repair protein)
LRFRLHRKDLPGKPDLVFPRAQVVIFVHGCFWHGHNCPMFKWPATRRDFWKVKISGNRKRDKSSVDTLQSAGWRVLVVWECALRGPGRRPVQEVLQECERFVRSSRNTSAEILGAQ